MSRRVYCALVHYPVKDREGASVSTSVTNLDVHDIARSSRTYQLSGYYLVTPITAQHAIIERILGHWEPGAAGAGRIPQRAEALRLITIARSIEEAIEDIQQRDGRWVIVDLEGKAKRVRTVPMPFPSDLVSRGDGGAPWPSMASVDVNVTFGTALNAPANVWVLLTTSACLPRRRARHLAASASNPAPIHAARRSSAFRRAD